MASPSLTDSLRETLLIFEESGAPRTTREVAEVLDLGRRSTYDRLDRLVDDGYLETKKVGASARVWWRPSAPAADSSVGPRSAAPVSSDSFLDDVLDGADVGVFVLNSDFEVAWINDAIEEFFGLERDAILGDDKRALVKERVASLVDDSEAFAESVLATYDDNTYTEQFECRVIAGDGRRERWLEHYSKPIESGPYEGGRIEFYEDITDRKRREHAHRQDREQFESLVDALEEHAIFTLDTDGRVQTWNAGAAQLKGYERDEILGEHFSLFYTDEERAANLPERNLARAADEGSVQDSGWRVRKDGSRFWADVTITPIYDGNDELDGYAKITHDVTDRREREQTIRRERDVLEKILETSPIGVVVLDGDGTVVRANERAESLLRMSTSRMEGQSYYEPEWEIRNEDGAVVSGDEHPITQVFETGEPILGFQHVIEFLDGVERWFSTNAAPVFDESGDVERVVVALEEITQLKEQARRLERRRDELESELEEVFDRISDGFYGLDEHFRFTYVNDRAETLLDLDESDVVGRNIRDVLDVTEPFDEALQEAAESAEPVFAEDYYDPLGGWFENVIYPSETGLSVYFRDITERKERERELEQYETIVETADDGIYAVDDEARFVMVNDRFCELTGYDRDELIGAHATTIHPDEVTPEAEALVNEIADGQRNLASIDLDIQTKGGDSIPCESRLAPFPIGDSYGRCGVVRDISARIEQEQTLKKRVAQQEVVTELGQRALENQDVDDLMREASRLVAETLDVAYCKVLELDDDREKFLVRQGVGWDEGTVGAATVSAIEDDSQASYTLASSGPVVVENLEADSRFSGPELLTSHDVQSGISVVIGAEDDPWGILGVHDTSHAEFSDHDVNFVQSVSNILATAISRRRDEEALLRQQEQLAALNSLNEVVREIIDAVIDQSTREEIERTVCEHLADTDSYMFAWIGDVDPNSQTVTLRTEAGVDGYLDDITISVDDDDERSEGATGRALRTGVTQTTQDVEVDSQYAPWREHVAEHGFRSSAAVPIVHEGTTYGVLNVYAQRPNAFEGEERHVIDQLGEVVGHAIAATERKRALMSDEVVELEFQIQNLFEFLDIDGMESGRISIDHSIPIEGDEYLVYGHATADAVDTLKAIVETTPHWREVTFHDEHADTKFELVLSEPPILSALASVGGSVVEAVIEDGTYRMKLHVSPSVDVRQITDAVQSAYPAATLLKRHQITRSGEAIDRIQRVLSTEITDRQRAAIEAAFHAGYFEWPRDATGEDVARSLGVSPPTFHQHLRKAQQQVFSSLLTVAV